MTHKTILLIASHAPSLINFRGPLIAELISRGYQVAVSAPNFTAKITSELEELGVQIYETKLSRTGLNPINDWAYLRSLTKLIAQVKPSFVLTYTIKPNIWGAFAAARHGVPSAAMITGLGFAFTDSSSVKKKIINKIARFLFKKSTDHNKYVIFQNIDDRDEFIRVGCLSDPSKAHLVNGSGVDLDHYAKTPLPEQPIFLMISRLLGNKGVREYCNAAMIVMKKYAGIRMLLVGELDQGPDCIAKSELESWISGGVEYLGLSEDVRQQISEASIFVLPSYREGTPRSVLEAMSMGRPILTSDAPGCRETTIHGQNGFLIPIKDVAALVEKMQWMIEHPEERKKMGEKSLQIAIEKYDVCKVNNSLLEKLGLL